MTFNARTDLTIIQRPSPTPTMGPAGHIITDPDFNTSIVRVTDQSTMPENPSAGSWFAAGLGGSADVNTWNTDSTMLYVQDAGGGGVIIGFDPTTMAVRRLFPSWRPSGALIFSRLSANTAFLFNGTTVNQYDLSNRSLSTPPSPTPVCNFSSLLPSAPTWIDAGGVEGGDTVFTAAFSVSGAQGTGVYACAYVVGSGFRLLNTQTGAVTGFGTTGTITLPDRFTLHNVKASKDGGWLVLAPTSRLSGTDNGPYFWNILTLNVVSVGTVAPGGHWTAGYSEFLNNDSGPSIPLWAHARRTFASVGTPTKVANPSIQPSSVLGPLDNHLSFNGPADSIFAVTSCSGGRTTFPTAWYDEVLGFTLDGSGVVYRFCHTFTSGNKGNFFSNSAIGVVDQQNQFVAFTSDWMSTLSGRLADVFIVKLNGSGSFPVPPSTPPATGAPTITSISSSVATPGTTFTATIVGTGFTGATVTVSGDAGTTVASFTVVNDTTINVTLLVAPSSITNTAYSLTLTVTTLQGTASGVTTGSGASTAISVGGVSIINIGTYVQPPVTPGPGNILLLTAAQLQAYEESLAWLYAMPIPKTKAGNTLVLCVLLQAAFNFTSSTPIPPPTLGGLPPSGSWSATPNFGPRFTWWENIPANVTEIVFPSGLLLYGAAYPQLAVTYELSPCTPYTPLGTVKPFNFTAIYNERQFPDGTTVFPGPVVTPATATANGVPAVACGGAIMISAINMPATNAFETITHTCTWVEDFATTQFLQEIDVNTNPSLPPTTFQYWFALWGTSHILASDPEQVIYTIGASPTPIPGGGGAGASGPAGFHRWAGSTAGVPVPIGIDAAGRLFAIDFYQNIYTFDFSAGPPASPTQVPWSLNPVPGVIDNISTSGGVTTGTQTFNDMREVGPADQSGNFWVVTRQEVGAWPTPGAPATGYDLDIEFQGYSSSTGAQLSTTSIFTGHIPYGGATHTEHVGGGTSFSVGGQAHVAIWYGVKIETGINGDQYFDSVSLEVFNVSSGTPVHVASLPFALNEFFDAFHGLVTPRVFDGCVFYDGVGSLWVFEYTLQADEFGKLLGGVVHKFSVPGYTAVASASFSGAYGFIGDSCSGHIYALNIDGSVSDINPTTLTAIVHSGIAGNIAPEVTGGEGAEGIAWINGWPITYVRLTYAMLNPIYGMSTDPVTSQFFMASPVTGGRNNFNAFTRVQNFVAIDTLIPFADWGLSDVSDFNPVWIPSEQAMFFWGGPPGGGGPFFWYELLYGKRLPFCAGSGGILGGQYPVTVATICFVPKIAPVVAVASEGDSTGAYWVAYQNTLMQNQITSLPDGSTTMATTSMDITDVTAQVGLIQHMRYRREDNSLILFGQYGIGIHNIDTALHGAAVGTSVAPLGPIDVLWTVVGGSLGYTGGYGTRIMTSNLRYFGQTQPALQTPVYTLANWAANVITATAGESVTYDAKDNSLWVTTSTDNLVYHIFLDRTSGPAVDIADIIAWLCDQTDLDSTQFDVTAIAGLYAVNGIHLGHEAVRDSILKITEIFQIDACETEGVIRFVPRNRPPQLIIDEEDIGALESISKTEPRIEEVLSNETDVPERISIIYYDPARDHQECLQYSKRISLPYGAGGIGYPNVTHSRTEKVIQTQLTSDATTIKQQTEKLLYEAWAARFSYTFKTTLRFLVLDPSDIIAVNYKGVVLEIRLLSIDRGAGLALQLKGVSHDFQVYDSVAVSSPGGMEPSI